MLHHIMPLSIDIFYLRFEENQDVVRTIGWMIS